MNHISNYAIQSTYMLLFCLQAIKLCLPFLSILFSLKLYRFDIWINYFVVLD